MVECTLSWLHNLKRLRIREERRDDIHLALLHLGCSLILLRRLEERADMVTAVATTLRPVWEGVRLHDENTVAVALWPHGNESSIRAELKMLEVGGGGVDPAPIGGRKHLDGMVTCNGAEIALIRAEPARAVPSLKGWSVRQSPGSARRPV